MKNVWRIMLLALCLVGCAREDIVDGRRGSGRPIDLVLSFGAPGDDVTVETKDTHTAEVENTIFNIFLFIFDMNKDGETIYAHYFDYENLGTTAKHLPDWWQVTNNDPNQGGATHGTIHAHTSEDTNCTIVAIANIDAEMVNISPEELDEIQFFSELEALEATLNQEITYRSGYFPMSAILTEVNTTISSEEDVYPYRQTLHFRRLDARIRVNVFVSQEEDENHQAVSKIADFKPLKWQVFNVPKTSFVLERGAYQEVYKTRAPEPLEQALLDDASGDSDADYFDQPETNFETEVVTEHFYSGTDQYKKFIHGFSFYMMENRKARKTSTGPVNFAEREERDRSSAHLNPGGATASVSNGAFVHPDDHSTYIVITGRVMMNNPTTTSAGGEVSTIGSALSGDVQYVIHLGDFSDATAANGKWGDYNIFRNHGYTYNVIINDVNDIRVEVDNNYEEAELADKTEEPEPAASGQVVIAKEEIYRCDAHYGSHVITFHASNIDADKVSWGVKTPFNPSGASPVVTPEGVDVTTGIDFEWVEFRLNARDDEGNYYDQRRQIYKPISMNEEGEMDENGTMNVSALVAYLKKQKKLYDEDMERKALDPTYTGWHSKFDKTDADYGGPKISVTCFVNEYYYERNPITKELERDLWKKFVNKPERFMYILSDVRTSADGESQIVGCSFTIEQRSIQSIYNANHPDLQSAWGSEFTDDEMERGYKVYDSSTPGTTDRGNTSKTNGRLNTLKEWGFVDKNGKNSKLGSSTLLWKDYMILDAPNETPIMKDQYQYLRYSCMSRNRDNNGNGVIDEDEVRWYMGAQHQLTGLFMGAYGIEGDARLYQRDAQQRVDPVQAVWRQHVIASTRYDGNNSSTRPLVIWAEEGISTGPPANSNNQSYAGINEFSTRCVRNLGYDPATGNDITYSKPDTEVDNYIVVKRMRYGEEYSGAWGKDVYYQFDCTRINEASLRYYTNRELVLHSEHALQACLYKRFECMSVSDWVSPPSVPGGSDVKDINDYLNGNIAYNPFCPPGYRLPNIRELAVMHIYIPDINKYFENQTGTSYVPCRTLWSFGKGGEYWSPDRAKVGERYAAVGTKENVHMEEINKNGATNFRCVRDIKDF